MHNKTTFILKPGLLIQYSIDDKLYAYTIVLI